MDKNIALQCLMYFLLPLRSEEDVKVFFEYLEKTQQNQNCTKLLLKKLVEYANGDLLFLKKRILLIETNLNLH